jgi:hypothetical protein
MRSRRRARLWLWIPPYEMPVTPIPLGLTTCSSTSSPSRYWVSRLSKRWSERWIQPRSHPGEVRESAAPHERPKPRAEYVTTA